jgi:hypothetical protein
VARDPETEDTTMNTRDERDRMAKYGVRVAELGLMATGSYGVSVPDYAEQSPPVRIIHPWAVICPRAKQPTPGFVFRTKTEADDFAAAEALREEGRAIERRAIAAKKRPHRPLFAVQD